MWDGVSGVCSSDLGDLDEDQGAVPDQGLGLREDLLDALLGEDRATGRNPAEDRDVGRSRHGIADAGLVGLDLVGIADGSGGGSGFGHEDLDGAWTGGVAIDEALGLRSEEHTCELQALMRKSDAVFCLKKKQTK